MFNLMQTAQEITIRIIIILLLFISTAVFSQEVFDDIDQNKEELQNIQTLNDIKDLKYQVEQFKIQLQSFGKEFVEHKNTDIITLNGILAQLSAGDRNLAIFNIIFALIAIGIGIYVTSMERKVSKIKEHSDNSLREVRRIKEELVELNNSIQHNISGLYEKIKDEETRSLLVRLSNVPEDISNISDILLAREIKDEGDNFVLLRKAYLQIKDTPDAGVAFLGSISRHDSYLLQFFQHFFYRAFLDSEIKEDLIAAYPQLIGCAFECDITYTTKDFIRAILELGLDNSKEDINAFFSKISESKFKENTSLYEAIFDSLLTKEFRLKLFTLLEKKPKEAFPTFYGEMLIREYQGQALSSTDKSIIDEITEYLSLEPETKPEVNKKK